MSIRYLSIRALVPTAMLLSAMTLAVSPSFSQQAPSGPQAPAPDTTPGQNPGSAPAPSTAAAPPASKVPDYPDPRGAFTLGVFGLWSPSSSGPDIRGGVSAAASNTYESLYGIGTPYKVVPQFEFSIPITRTGVLYVELQRYHGWADQTLGRDTFVDSFSFVNGDSMHSTYHVLASRIYLDDLLFPHKFPVARLRFKSIWGLRYISVSDSVDSASEDATAGVPDSSFQIGSHYILYPEFGAAMEYAVAPHVLFRVDGAGFGFPHHSDIGEASATLSVRRNNLEFLMGAKMLHFKTSPQKDEYDQATFVTPFVGLRWHF